MSLHCNPMAHTSETTLAASAAMRVRGAPAIFGKSVIAPAFMPREACRGSAMQLILSTVRPRCVGNSKALTKS